MTRFVKIPEYEDFFKSLKETLNNYAISINKTIYTYFASILHIKGQNAKHSFGNLINPNTGKDLKVRELILLLDNCPEHQKPVLDFLCNRYNFICSDSAADNLNIDNIKDSLLKVGGDNGKLYSDFLEFTEDEELDLNELKSLKNTSSSTRGSLKNFENLLDKKIKGLEDDL